MMDRVEVRARARHSAFREMTADELRAMQTLAACPSRTLQVRMTLSLVRIVRHYGRRLQQGNTLITGPDAALFVSIFADMMESNRCADAAPHECERCHRELPAHYRVRNVCNDCLTTTEIADLSAARLENGMRDVRRLLRRAARETGALDMVAHAG